jgi:hypothetical protein
MVHAMVMAVTIPAAMAEATAVGMAEIITPPGAVIRAAMEDPIITVGGLPAVMEAATLAATAGAITAAVMAEAIPVGTAATEVDTAATAAVTTGAE